MATGAASSWRFIAHTPGNPQLPTLPNPGDPIEGINDQFVGGAAINVPRATTIFLDENAAGPGVAKGFARAWLNQIGVFPDPIDFGNITAAKTTTVTIHNTFRTSVTITSLDLSGIPGLTLLSPGLPVVVPPFSSVVFTLEAGPSGDPSFDATVNFVTTAGTITLRLIGRRVLIFDARGEEPIVETVTFGTDVMTAESGKEQVMSWRRTPRSIVSFTVRDTDDEIRTRLQTKILGAGQLLHGVQLWWQAQIIDVVALDTDTVIQVDTRFMEVADGDTVAFVLPDLTSLEAEVLTVGTSDVTLSQAVGTALPFGTFMMPIKFGFLRSRNPLITYPVNAEDLQVAFTLIEYANIGAVDATIFATHPVDGLPIHIGGLYFDGQGRRGEIEADDDRLDSETGAIANRRRQLLARPNVVAKVICRNLAEQHAWRRFLHFLRGSWGRFYVPTGVNDLPIQTSFTLGGNSFNIEHMGIDTFIGNVAPRRDVRITIAGVSYYRRVTSVTDNVTFETVVVDSIIPGAGVLDPSEVKVEWLTLARINSDTATFRHLNGGVSELRFGVRGVIES